MLPHPILFTPFTRRTCIALVQGTRNDATLPLHFAMGRDTMSPSPWCLYTMSPQLRNVATPCGALECDTLQLKFSGGTVAQ